MPISKQTAMDIALAHREVETAETMLAEIREARSRHEIPDLRDAFGRQHDCLELGVPSGHNARRLFRVSWSLATPVIMAHIAEQKAIIETLSEKAKSEIAETKR